MSAQQCSNGPLDEQKSLTLLPNTAHAAKWKSTLLLRSLLLRQARSKRDSGGIRQSRLLLQYYCC
jgi:hypothetical protein